MDKYRKVIPYIIIILAIIGLLFSYILAQEYYFGSIYKKSGEQLSVFSDFSSRVCGGQSSFVSCESVASSTYSKIMGIPVAVWGMFYFSIMIALSCLLFLKKEKIISAVEMVFFWYVLYGTIFDIVLAFISLFIIKAVCSLCILTYISVWGSMAFIIIYFKRKALNPLHVIDILKDIFISQKRSVVIRQILIIGSIVFVSSGLSFGTNYHLKNKKEDFAGKGLNKQIEQAFEKFKGTKRIDVDPPNALIVGKPGAPVTIVEISDFLCPFCSRAAAVIDELVREHPEKVKAIFVNYPLDKKCNKISRTLHPGACILAKGSICASRQNKFNKYHEIVFQMRPKNPGPGEMKQIARLADLNIAEFNTCMASYGAEEELQEHINKSKKLKIRGTPTIFINGKHYKFKPIKILMEKIIDLESGNR